MEIKGRALFATRQGNLPRKLEYDNISLESDVINNLYSAVNYKDRLLISGNATISKHKRIIPGIDAIGTLKGELISLCGFDYGVENHGGWSSICSIKNNKYTNISGLKMTPKECAIYGTPGLTASLIFEYIQQYNKENNINDPSIVINGANTAVGKFCNIFLGTAYTSIYSTDTRYSDPSSMFRNHPTKTAFFSSQKRITSVVDLIGGSSISSLIHLIRPGGVIYVVGNIGGNLVQEFSAASLFLDEISIRGVNLERQTNVKKAQLWGSLDELNQLVKYQLKVTKIKFGDLQKILSSTDYNRTIVEL